MRLADEPQRHLDVGEVSAYVDRRLDAAVRARVEAHLAVCETCRVEVIEVGRIARSLPVERRWRVLVPLAAAAAVLLLLVQPGGVDEVSPPPLREPAVTSTVQPRPIEPVGRVAEPDTLRWSAVPKSDRYRLTLYDGEGLVIWKAQTTDTAAAVPDSVRLRSGRWYYWRVEARTSLGRWAASELTSFTVAPPEPTR